MVNRKYIIFKEIYQPIDISTSLNINSYAGLSLEIYDIFL